jgi:hypothetical protein
MKNSSEQTRLLLHNKNWPTTAGWFSNKLNEVIPNLKEMGIVIDRPYDKVRKAYTITMVRNEVWKSVADREKEATEVDAKAEAASKERGDRK